MPSARSAAGTTTCRPIEPCPSLAFAEWKSKRGNGKATLSLILGICAFISFLALAMGLAGNQSWLMDNDNGSWLMLPFVALAGGGSAALIGSIAWIDVRRGRTTEGLREAQFGSILGGIAAGALLLACIGLMIIFLVMMIAFPDGD
ncbi:MAG: hypothetical protein ACSLFD_01555 [Solirubrobacterales bacterium]